MTITLPLDYFLSISTKTSIVLCHQLMQAKHRLTALRKVFSLKKRPLGKQGSIHLLEDNETVKGTLKQSPQYST
jgi:hypothetical protein